MDMPLKKEKKVKYRQVINLLVVCKCGCDLEIVMDVFIFCLLEKHLMAQLISMERTHRSATNINEGASNKLFLCKKWEHAVIQTSTFLPHGSI